MILIPVEVSTPLNSSPLCYLRRWRKGFSYRAVMSLKDLKNTLKACTSSSSAPPQSASLHPQRDEHDGHQRQQRDQRKPPKTSLKQQLAGLDQLAADLDIHTNQSTVSEREQNAGDVQSSERGTKKRWTFSGGEEPVLTGTWEDEKPSKDGEEVADSEAGVYVQPHTEGPFEPLILSSARHHSDPSRVVQVPASINCRLLEHQREGVKFLYKLYKENHGGVLGDDMGLGKTIQTIAFLAAVLQKDTESDDFVVPWSTRRMNLKKHVENKKLVLIICPTSVLRNWENEFHEWGTFNVAIYHGPNRELVLEKLEASDVEIVLTSFDTFRIHGESLCEVQWEIVIVDEAHRLKNEKSQLYKACLRIKTKKCYGLTGTIVQNKIMDLFNVFDWVAPGCLGTRDHFREFYDEPLKQGQRISAPERFVCIAEERKQHLVRVLQKYLLRRTKEETIGHLMMGKEDNVVFCAMSSLQRRVYRRLLDSLDFQCLITKDLPCSCGSPLTRIECCHRTVPEGIIWSYLHRDNPDGCDSCPFCLVLPCLVKLQQVSNHLELVKPNPKDDPEKQKKDEALAVAVFQNDAGLIGGTTQDESFMGLSDAQHCGKMRALEKLMASWISQGDKVLLFSYSVRMLDILEKFLIRKGYCFSRLDGSTPMSSRQSLVDDFNNSPSKQVFLISTRAGGLGLNLVSANRVVIFDPNWNPAQDLQAQDRSFRYGQKRHVTVFRLLAAGSLEELVYTRQIYKQQLFNIAVSGNLEKRYFEGVQDSKEFKGELFGICNLFRDLSDKLFTSEIVELHEERMQEYGHHGATGNGPVTGSAPSSDKPTGMSEKAANSSVAAQAETIPAIGGKNVVISKGKRKDNLPKLADVLSDAGVIYVHRNEDVVNFGVHYQDGCAEDKDELKHKKLETRQLKKMDFKKPPMANEKTRESKKSLVSTKAGGTTNKKLDKTKQYSLLAQFMGMTELEFSKWLLSASPSERDKLLADYKKWIQNSKG